MRLHRITACHPGPLCLMVLVACYGMPPNGHAAGPAKVETAATAAPQGGPEWRSLSAAQQTALAPLRRDWSTIEPAGKQKWLELASRFPTMPAPEQQRVQARMADWARMTPAQRTQARLQFQEARQLSPEDRQAKWDAYQALPETERRELAERARSARSRDKPASKDSGDPKSAASSDGKRNIVQPDKAATRAVTPAVVQAKPGATTTLMSSKANPPGHHQAGMPKIVATEGFVDPSTLLPQRGPQGAAVQKARPPGTGASR